MVEFTMRLSITGLGSCNAKSVAYGETNVIIALSDGLILSTLLTVPYFFKSSVIFSASVSGFKLKISTLFRGENEISL